MPNKKFAARTAASLPAVPQRAPRPSPTHPETLDTAGAADVMKVSEETVLRLIRSGVLSAAKVGRAYVLLYDDVFAHVVREVTKQTAKRMRRPALVATQLRTSPPQ